MQEPPQATLAAKVDFLSHPGSFPDEPGSVECIETHFSWVFLSGRFVYKLKKPLRFRSIDFTNLQTRKANCELEVTLNRRLAEAVYIAVVPLCVADSSWRLEGDGQPIEWLVKMHRLPRDRMLDHAALEGTVTAAELKVLVTKLTAFYQQTPHAPWNESDYLRRLDQSGVSYGSQLSEPAFGLDAKLIQRLVVHQRSFVEGRADQLGARIPQGRIVDTHGDLRPEHIFLADNPQVIDCLEFSTELRLQDSAEEVAFLALECDRLGHSRIGEQILELYRDVGEDPVSPELLDFYRSRRALVRALLSAWHLQNIDIPDAEHWVQQANWYLEAARESIERAL